MLCKIVNAVSRMGSPRTIERPLLNTGDLCTREQTCYKPCSRHCAPYEQASRLHSPVLGAIASALFGSRSPRDRVPVACIDGRRRRFFARPLQPRESGLSISFSPRSRFPPDLSNRMVVLHRPSHDRRGPVFGFELTFFRRGIPPDDMKTQPSQMVDHTALSGSFRHHRRQRTAAFISRRS